MAVHHISPMLSLRSLILVASLCALLVVGVSNALQADDSGVRKNAKVTYDDQVLALLKRRCSSCHSGDRTEADLDVVNFVALMQGGGSGAVIEAGAADDSYLFRLVNHDDSPAMPPSGGKIPKAEIKLLRDWIDQGALENADSKVKKRKPKVDLTKVSANLNARPDVAPALPKLSLEPVMWTKRKSPVRAIAVNPWSPIVAITAPKQVVLFDTETLALKGVIPFTKGIPEVLRFSRNGSILLIGGGVAGDSGIVLVWDVAKGEVVQTIGDELDSVLACDITSDHSLVAIGGPKKVVRVYSTADGALLYELNKHTDWITAIEFSPDGKELASGDRNGGLIVSDAQTGNENFDLTGHKAMVTSIAWRIDGKILASTSKDKSVRIWEMRKGKQIKTWGADGKGVTEICFLPGGNLLTTGRNKNVKLWQQDGKQLQTFNGLGDMGMGLAYCASADRVVAGNFQGEVLVWDRGSPISVGKININPPPISERIIDVNQQLVTARQNVDADHRKLKNHDTMLDQMTAEVSDMQNRFADTKKNIDDAKTEIESAKKTTQDARSKLKKLNQELAKSETGISGDGDSDTDDSDVASSKAQEDAEALKLQRQQLKAEERLVTELDNRMTVLNNQIVAWDGAAAVTKARLAELQKETGRLKDLRRPLVEKLETSRAEFNRLGNVLKFWKAEAVFANGQK